MEYTKETEIMSLLDQMEELLEEGKTSFITSKVSIDRNEFFEYIKDIRMKLPTELQQSVWIVEERNKILAEAQGEAKLIIQEAQETLQKMIEQHEITKYANETVKVVEQQLKLTLEAIHKEAQNFENYITNELRILYDHRQELKEMIHPQPVMEERE